MLGAVQAFDALNADGVGAGAGNAGAHGDQAVGQVDDFRFAGSVFNDGFAGGETGGQHQVFRAGDSDHVGTDAGALEAVCLGVYITLLDGHFGAHGLQSLDVLIDRTGADGAAAGQ